MSYNGLFCICHSYVIKRQLFLLQYEWCETSLDRRKFPLRRKCLELNVERIIEAANKSFTLSYMIYRLPIRGRHLLRDQHLQRCLRAQHLQREDPPSHQQRQEHGPLERQTKDRPFLQVSRRRHLQQGRQPRWLTRTSCSSNFMVLLALQGQPKTNITFQESSGGATATNVLPR